MITGVSENCVEKGVVYIFINETLVSDQFDATVGQFRRRRNTGAPFSVIKNGFPYQQNRKQMYCTFWGLIEFAAHESKQNWRQ